MSWFAFDIDAYDADTMHLSLAEDGAYSRLLRFYYKTRLPLPDDDRALAAIARISLAEWEPMRETIRAFFRKRRGKLVNKKAETTLDREDFLAQKRSDKARGAAQKRHAISKGSEPQASPEQSPSQDSDMLGDATRPDHTKKESKIPVADATAPQLALDLKREVWRAGKALLCRHGLTEAKAGALIGRWRRDCGDGAVLDALAAAETAEPSGDIVEYLTGCMKRRTPTHGKPTTRIAPAAAIFHGAALALADRAARREREAHRGTDLDPPVPLLDG